MSQQLIPYDPNACRCCGCYGFAVVEQRGTVYKQPYDFAFQQYKQDPDVPSDFVLRWFRTQTQFGLRNISPSVVQLLNNACSFTGELTLTGSHAVKYYVSDDHGAPGTAWVNCFGTDEPPYLAFLRYDPPFDETTSCDDTFYGFDVSTWPTGSATRIDDPILCPPDTYPESATSILSNEMLTADWLALGIELADEAWTEVSGSDIRGVTYTAESVFYTPNTLALRHDITTGLPLWSAEPFEFGYKLSRKQFLFPIPRSGTGWRVTFDIMWLPAGDAIEDAVLYDSVEWQWDEVVPGGYDENDSDTWPRSGWFELPAPEEPGVYFMANTAFECTPATSPGAPGDVSVEQIA